MSTVGVIVGNAGAEFDTAASSVGSFVGVGVAAHDSMVLLEEEVGLFAFWICCCKAWCLCYDSYEL